MIDPARHRRLIVLRGTPQETFEASLDLLQSLATLTLDQALWVGEVDLNQPQGSATHKMSSSRVSSSAQVARPREVKRLLGSSFEVVVVDLHHGLDPDTLGQSHGLVWGGGALILRLPVTSLEEMTPLSARWERALGAAQPSDLIDEIHLSSASSTSPVTYPLPSLSLARSAPRATREQDEVVDAIVDLFTSPTPQRIALIADRGRGKSSALGIAARRVTLASSNPDRSPISVGVTAGQELAAREALRFAWSEAPLRSSDSAATAHTLSPPNASRVEFIPLRDLIWGSLRTLDILLVDEAAQLPVPVLQKLTERYATAHLIFATTTRGYEGTGRGFLLRFLTWLEDRPEGLTRLTLTEPIRWALGDPLEGLISSVLLFDAEPDDPPKMCRADVADVEHLIYQDRGELGRDEVTLRGIFGLLIHAHYRTTPRDLKHLLEAPNVEVHALRWRGAIVAATLIAREGALTPETCEELYWGRTRVRGNALADVMVSHLGALKSGELSMIRSVRIATHPNLRRLGLGSALIERVHATYQPDLFGTLFGVTEGLLDFRRQAGYELAWVSASRGSRTGEPAALMLRPLSNEAHALFNRLRLQLARDLPAQLELFVRGRELLLSQALRHSLTRGLISHPPPLDELEHMRRVTAYLRGPRTFESSVSDLTRFAQRSVAHLSTLTSTERALIESRVLAGEPWERAMERAQLPSLSATMRALRRALRELALFAEETP